MSQNTRTQSTNMEKAKEQVAEKTPESIIETIATQLDRLNEAKERIDQEGVVVRDLKGSVIPHPAIKIEIDATKLLSELLNKHKESTDFLNNF